MCRQNDYKTPAIFKAHMWANGCINLVVLGVPNMGTKSEVATQPLPFGGPTCGQNGYKTPAILGVPNVGTKSEMAT